MTTADVICVMNLGKIERTASPGNLRPAGVGIRPRFIGMSNVFKGKTLDGTTGNRPECRCVFPAKRSRAAPTRRSRSGSIRTSFWEGTGGKGQRRPGQGGAASGARIEPGLYGRHRGRHSAPARDLGGRERRAGFRGLAQAAAGEMPGIGPIATRQLKDKKPKTSGSDGNREDCKMGKRFTRRDALSAPPRPPSPSTPPPIRAAARPPKRLRPN